MKSKPAERQPKPNEFSLAVGRALRRAARRARETARDHGTPIYVSKNGKVVAIKPILREGEVGAGDVWERIARNEEQVSVIERYRQYFQEAGD